METKLEIVTEDLPDWIDAERAGRIVVHSMKGDARALNSFAWRLLTEEPYRGHLAGLALHAARAMQSDEAWRTYWRLDTLALAEFENGHLEVAVRLQEEALQSCDSASKVRYAERLAEYRNFASGAVRPSPVRR